MKIVTLNALRQFCIKLKEIFVTKEYVDESLKQIERELAEV